MTEFDFGFTDEQHAHERYEWVEGWLVCANCRQLVSGDDMEPA